jgi:hypothetical protein
LVHVLLRFAVWGSSLHPPHSRQRHARGGAGQGILEKIPAARSHLPDLEDLRGLVGILPARDFSHPVIFFLVSHGFYLLCMVGRPESRP